MKQKKLALVFNAKLRVVFVPAQLKRLDLIQRTYKCQSCSDEGLADKIIKAPVPKAPLAHSFWSASIISHTIHQKFNLKVPNYRQEEDCHKMDLPITRKELANCTSNQASTILSLFMTFCMRNCWLSLFFMQMKPLIKS